MQNLTKNTFLLSISFRNLISFKTLVPFSTSTTTQDDQPHHHQPHNSIIVDHLISSFGFTKDKAISVSKDLPHTVSTTYLNRVPDLLKQTGFSDTHIKNLILKLPRLLSFKDETLKPKLSLLQELGFSGCALADLVVKNPSIVLRGIDHTLKPTVDLLRLLLNSNENIAKVIKKRSWLLSFDAKLIRCNVETLRECGILDKQIAKVLLRNPRFFMQNPDQMKDLVSRAEKFGFQKGSGALIYAAYSLGCMTLVNLEAKFDMYRSLGWSESDILSAFRKSPAFLMASEQKVKAVMDFFVGELGYNPKDIALKPSLLKFSLDKKLKPRHKVFKILKSRGLETKSDFLPVAELSEKKFLERCVLRYVDKYPDLQEAYLGNSSIGS